MTSKSSPKDKASRRAAETIRESFWAEYETALEPGRASKQLYKEQLEELIFEAESRLEAAIDELEEAGELDSEESEGNEAD